LLVRTSNGQTLTNDLTNKTAEDAENNATNLRTEAPPSEGLSVSEARRHLKDAIAELDASVRIVADIDAARAIMPGVSPDANAFAINDQIVIIAGRYRSFVDLEFSLWHEVSHIGFRRKFKQHKDYTKALRRLAESNPDILKAAAKWRKDFAADAQKRYENAGWTPAEATEDVWWLSVEEALSDRAGDMGSMVNLKGWDSFVQAVVKVLRAMNLNALAYWAENGNVALVVKASRDAAMGRRSAAPPDMPAAYSRSAPGAWFSVSGSVGGMEDTSALPQISKNSTAWKDFRVWFRANLPICS